MLLHPWSVEGMWSFPCLRASNLPLTLVGKGTWPFWISFLGMTSNNDSSLLSWDTISMKQRLSVTQTNIQCQFQFFVAKWLPSPPPLLYATLDIIKYHCRRRKWRLSVIHFTRTSPLIVGCLANLKGEMCQNPGGSISILSSSHPGLSLSVATWVISLASGFVTVALHESPECPTRFREHIQTLLRGTQSSLSFALPYLIRCHLHSHPPQPVSSGVCSWHVTLSVSSRCFWTHHCHLLASVCLSLLSELTCLFCDWSLPNHSGWTLGQKPLGLRDSWQRTEYLPSQAFSAQQAQPGVDVRREGLSFGYAPLAS